MNENQVNRMSVSTLTIIKIIGVLLGLYVLYLVRDIILLLIISFILSSALTPLVDWLYSKFRFPRGLTVILVYLVFIGVVALIFSLLIPQLITEFTLIGSNISGYQDQFSSQSEFIFDTAMRFGLEDSIQSFGETLTNLTSNLFQATVSVFVRIFDIITVLVVSFYLVIEQDGMKNFIKSLTPPQYHGLIAQVVTKVQRKLGQWLLGQLALMFSIFLLTYVALSLIGVKYALVLALVAGLLEVLPYIGPILSAVPAAFVGFLQSPILLVVVIVLYTLIQQVENYLLAPRILGKSVGANPLVILIALLVGYNIAGVLGMVIAAPVVAIVTVILEDYGSFTKMFAESERTG